MWNFNATNNGHVTKIFLTLRSGREVFPQSWLGECFENNELSMKVSTYFHWIAIPFLVPLKMKLLQFSWCLLASHQKLTIKIHLDLSSHLKYHGLARSPLMRMAFFWKKRSKACMLWPIKNCEIIVSTEIWRWNPLQGGLIKNGLRRLTRSTWTLRWLWWWTILLSFFIEGYIKSWCYTICTEKRI